GATGSSLMAERIAEATDCVREGKPLSGPLAAGGFFSEQILSMISVAGGSKKLGKILFQITYTGERGTNRQVGQGGGLGGTGDSVRGGGGNRIFGLGLATSDLYNGKLFRQTLGTTGVLATGGIAREGLEPMSWLAAKCTYWVSRGGVRVRVLDTFVLF